MAQTSIKEVLAHLRKMFAIKEGRDLPDSVLLEWFQKTGDEAPFTILLQRHGPMIMAVCRRVLDDAHAAEDAFQATFAVFVRQSKSMRLRGTLGGWLYTVAQRIAVKAKKQDARRHDTERRRSEMAQTETLNEVSWQELRGVLDEEIARLPEKYRTPLVLCHLQGKTQEQAAKELGCPKGSLTNRVLRAREMLRERLVKRGVTVTAAALATVLTEKMAQAQVGALLTLHTVKGVLSLAAGKAAASKYLTAQAIALAEEAMRSMIWLKAKSILLVLTLGLAVGGGGLAGFGGRGKESPAVDAAAEQAEQAKPQKVDADAKAPAAIPQKQEVKAADEDFNRKPDDDAVSFLPVPVLLNGRSFAVVGIAFSPDGKTVAAAQPAAKLGSVLDLWDTRRGTLLVHIEEPNVGIRSPAYSRDGKVLVTTDGLGKAAKVRDPQTGKVLRALRGHTKAVDAVAVSPDGKKLATGSLDTLVKVWDLAEGRELMTLQGHNGNIHCVVFSPDGLSLASASGDGTAKVWDLATGRERFTFTHEDEVRGVAFSPDGSMLATAGWDKSARLWKTADGSLLATLTLDNAVWSVAFAPDGKTLATGGGARGDAGAANTVATGQPGEVKLWDLANFAQKASLEGHQDYARAVAFSPDGKMLASGSQDKTVKLWDIAARKELFTLSNSPPGSFVAPNAVLGLAYSPDGKMVAVVGDDGLVQVCEPSTGKRRFVLKGHADIVTCLAFAPDGKLLATGSPDKTVKLWDSATGAEVRTLKGHTNWIYALTFSSDSKQLASGSYDKTVRVWEVASGATVKVLQGHGASVRAVAFSPDGQTLASGSGDRTIKLWDLPAGSERLTLKGHEGSVRALVFTPDGKSLVSGGEDSKVRIWDVADGKERKVLTGHKQDVVALAISPKGRTLVTGSLDGNIDVWDPLTGQLRHTLQGHKEGVLALALSADRHLVSGGNDKLVKLWSPTPAATVLRERSTFVVPGKVWNAALSPDGKTLATASETTEESVRLWDLASGKELRRMDHMRNARGVAFSPDGKLLASGGNLGNVKLWNPATGQQLAELTGQNTPAGIFSLAFTRDGRMLTSATTNGVACVWQVEADKLPAAGQPALTVPVRFTVAASNPQVWFAVPSADGKRIITGGGDQGSRFWQVDADAIRQIPLTLQRPLGFLCAALSPDGKTLAAAGGFGTEIFDTASGARLVTCLGGRPNPLGIVRSVAFSPSGKLLASGGRDTLLAVSDAASGKEVSSLMVPGEVMAVAFTPDGQALVAVCDDGTVKVYDTEKLEK